MKKTTNSILCKNSKLNKQNKGDRINAMIMFRLGKGMYVKNAEANSLCLNANSNERPNWEPFDSLIDYTYIIWYYHDIRRVDCIEIAKQKKTFLACFFSISHFLCFVSAEAPNRNLIEGTLYPIAEKIKPTEISVEWLFFYDLLYLFYNEICHFEISTGSFLCILHIIYLYSRTRHNTINAIFQKKWISSGSEMEK